MGEELEDYEIIEAVQPDIVEDDPEGSVQIKEVTPEEALEAAEMLKSFFEHQPDEFMRKGDMMTLRDIVKRVKGLASKRRTRQTTLEEYFQ